MNRLRIRHLGVTDDRGRVIGALSARDLLRLRAETSVELGDEIEQASDVHGLARAWAKLPQVAAGLLAEDLSGVEIAGLDLASSSTGIHTQRAAVLAEQRMRQDGLGDAAVRLCVRRARLGWPWREPARHGPGQRADLRRRGRTGGAADRWFAALGEPRGRPPASRSAFPTARAA